MSANSFYVGNVFHARFEPFRHAFRYGIFSMLLDLANLPRVKGFAHNRFAMLSFHDRDHGAGDGSPPRDWAITQLRSAGYSADDSWAIRLLCFPRLWGFVFNPLAIYFCADGSGTMQALIHQVSNTFGERHSYVLPADGPVIRQTCAKHFHVSPFMPVDGHYRFTIAAPDEKLDVRIDYCAADGTPMLVATQHGTRRDVTFANCLKLVASHPLMTLKIVAAIHWEALHLWRKGARFFRKPAPPSMPISFPVNAAE